jgi:hypothetical protein
MPQFTPAKAAVAVAALLLAGLGIAYAAGIGGDDSTPVDDVSPTMTTSSTTPATDDPSHAVSGAPGTVPATPPASGATGPAPTQAAPTKAAPAPSSYSPRPTPTTTEITTDMGPGAHDGDGE